MIVKQESNSQHWYDKNCKPAYTIMGNNGK